MPTHHHHESHRGGQGGAWCGRVCRGQGSLGCPPGHKGSRSDSVLKDAWRREMGHDGGRWAGGSRRPEGGARTGLKRKRNPSPLPPPLVTFPEAKSLLLLSPFRKGLSRSSRLPRHLGVLRGSLPWGTPRRWAPGVEDPALFTLVCAVSHGAWPSVALTFVDRGTKRMKV